MAKISLAKYGFVRTPKKRLHAQWGEVLPVKGYL